MLYMIAMVYSIKNTLNDGFVGLFCSLRVANGKCRRLNADQLFWFYGQHLTKTIEKKRLTMIHTKQINVFFLYNQAPPSLEK